MMATAATTPITTPAIAPPDIPELLLALLALPAVAASDDVWVEVGEDVGVDEDVEAVEVDAIVEVFSLEMITFSALTSNAANVRLAFLRHGAINWDQHGLAD